MPRSDIAELVQAFTDAMTTDDIDAVVGLFNNAPDVEWVIMATGEQFRGLDGIRRLAERSVAARSHGDGLGIKPKSVFTNAEGSQMCWEYVHKGTVTEAAATSSISSESGSTDRCALYTSNRRLRDLCPCRAAVYAVEITRSRAVLRAIRNTPRFKMKGSVA